MSNHCPSPKPLPSGTRTAAAPCRTSRGWLKELRGEHVPETEEYGIGSFIYQAQLPFHPQRFHDFLYEGFSQGRLLRSKGFFWLASRPDEAGSWQQAGGIMNHGPAGLWWAAEPVEHWPDDPEALTHIRQRWQEPFGDRRQEIVFIGQHLDRDGITAALDACLLTPAELSEGRDRWQRYPDPFPAWREQAA